MQNAPPLVAYHSKSEYINQLRFENDQSFREGVAISALLSQSAFQLLLTFTRNAELKPPEILGRSVDIQWRAVEELTDLKSLQSFCFEDLYSGIFKEGDELVETEIEVFPSTECIESPIGCILGLHMFLSSPEKLRLTKALSSYIHQSTKLAVDRLTAQGEDVSGVITPEKDAKIDNAQEVIIYIDLLDWIFEEAGKLSRAPENFLQSRAECQKRSDAVIAEAESLRRRSDFVNPTESSGQ